MKRAERNEWVAALRSGDYIQGQGSLNAGGKQCCLGVKCLLDARAGRNNIVEVPSGENIRYHGKDDVGSYGAMPSLNILRAWKMSVETGDELARMNDKLDSYGIHVHNFKKIADWIEENVEVED